MTPGPEELLPERVAAWSVLSFSQVYDLEIHSVFQAMGICGPLHIYNLDYTEILLS